MLRIRLTRIGAKKKPIYRLVVAERSRARDGRFIEIVGHYNPRTTPKTIRIDLERVRYWLSRGAQPSETAERLIRWAEQQQEPIASESA